MAAVNPPKLYGEFDFSQTTGTKVSFDYTGAPAAFAPVIATATYFIRLHSAGGDTATGLLEALVTAVKAGDAGEFEPFTATISSSGFVTLACDAVFTVTWNNDTTLRDILGFTGTLSGASTYTATNQAKYTWHPNVPPSMIQSHLSVQGMVTSDAKVNRAPSGRVVTTTFTEYTDNEFTFGHLTDDYVFPVGYAGSTITNRDYYTFWSDVIKSGRRFRYYKDNSVHSLDAVLTTTAPWEFVGDKDAVVKGTDAAARVVEGWDRMWMLKLGVHKYV